MNRPIKIGFLRPYSGVYPFYGQHFMAGHKMGLNYDPCRQNNIQFIPAHTKMGDALDVVNKLLFFDQVDIVSGLISYKSVPDTVPLMDKFNKLAFFFNLGKYIPYFHNLSRNIFYSSQQIWQSGYVLGNWANKKFGDTGILVMPFYESDLAVNPQLEKRDWDSVKKLLSTESVTSPRRERNFYPLSGFSLPVVDIVKVKTSLQKILKTTISRGGGLKFDSQDFKEIREECVSGWQNPYLCI